MCTIFFWEAYQRTLIRRYCPSSIWAPAWRPNRGRQDRNLFFGWVGACLLGCLRHRIFLISLCGHEDTATTNLKQNVKISGGQSLKCLPIAQKKRVKIFASIWVVEPCLSQLLLDFGFIWFLEIYPIFWPFFCLSKINDGYSHISRFVIR